MKAAIAGGEIATPIHPYADVSELGFESRDEAQQKLATAAALRAQMAQL